MIVCARGAVLRNYCQNHATAWNNCNPCSLLFYSEGRHPMAFRRGEQIVETAQEARQAERGPTVRNVLLVNTGLAIVAFSIILLMFLRT